MNKGRILVGVQFAALAVLIFYPGKKVSDTQNLIGTAIEILGAGLLVLGLINLRDSLKITPEPRQMPDLLIPASINIFVIRSILD